MLVPAQPHDVDLGGDGDLAAMSSPRAHSRYPGSDGGLPKALACEGAAVAPVEAQRQRRARRSSSPPDRATARARGAFRTGVHWPQRCGTRHPSPIPAPAFPSWLSLMGTPRWAASARTRRRSRPCRGVCRRPRRTARTSSSARSQTCSRSASASSTAVRVRADHRRWRAVRHRCRARGVPRNRSARLCDGSTGTTPRPPPTHRPERCC